jgi:hypothetical protein
VARRIHDIACDLYRWLGAIYVQTVEVHGQVGKRNRGQTTIKVEDKSWSVPVCSRLLRERFLAKFWLNPVALAGSKQFASHELRIIQKHVDENREIFLEAWNEHIGS